MSQTDRNEESVLFKRSVISEIAHEGRNSVQEIHAGLSLLDAMLENHAEAREVLRDAAKSERRLERLLDDLDDYRAPIRPDRHACDLSEVWSTAWTQAIGEPKQSEMHPYRVNADPGLLVKAFRRILEFALGAAPTFRKIGLRCSESESEGNAMVCVSLRAQPEACSDDQVAPTGPGSRIDGLTPGLSLAIAERVVEAHGGRIETRSDPERGVEIDVLLPKE